MDDDQSVVGHGDDFVERLRDLLRSSARRDVDVEGVSLQELVADPASRYEGDVAGVVEPVVGGCCF